jgi:hypothetical protein
MKHEWGDEKWVQYFSRKTSVEEVTCEVWAQIEGQKLKWVLEIDYDGLGSS